MSYSPLELTGKTAVVIGGRSGIGRAIAHGLAEAGAGVIPTSRRIEQVNSTANEVEQRGRRGLRVSSDVSDRASLENEDHRLRVGEDRKFHGAFRHCRFGLSDFNRCDSSARPAT